ncbi:MAG TPA: ABC transporter permease [Acidimicrobiales bacterium]|nr:ABC transporter permease [Acidimicrobiales bacterium]
MITLRSRYVIERNALAYRRMWPIFLAGFFEPILFLLSIGLGVGALVGDVPGPGGHLISYQMFVAPGMLAVAAMNGAILDSTFSFFVKFKYLGSYDTMLATPLSTGDLVVGEVSWGLLRGALYGGAFLVTMAFMGLVPSWWGVLAIPAALLIGFAFAGVGLACTTWMRSFIDFDFVNLVLAPMFLLSGTFFPLSRYPGVLQWVVRATPLYQGVALERSLVVGAISATLILNALYLAAMGAAGLTVANRRLGPILQP